MWIFLPNAMISIVAHRQRPDFLLVRARIKGDIERVFPGAIVTRSPRADYLYRATVHRDRVASTLSQHLVTMTYANVKGAIPVGDSRRRSFMHATWHVMHSAQHAAEPFQGMDAREELPQADDLPSLFTGAWFAHTTTRGEPRTVHVSQVQERLEDVPLVSLDFTESDFHASLPYPVAQQWLRNASPII